MVVSGGRLENYSADLHPGRKTERSYKMVIAHKYGGRVGSRKMSARILLKERHEIKVYMQQ